MILKSLGENGEGVNQMVLNCKVCGGDLKIVEGSSICKCQYCGKEQTIPKTDDEHILNMLNRANYFRQKLEFDKAIEIYEQLLNNGNEDAEIYWSLVLCRYGIEYVDEPKTLEKIPTCHRMQYASILKDTDYLMAIERADANQKIIFEKEAGYIAEIQKEILKISNKEAPFDIFICYKETDEQGSRTEDSILAQELYYELKKKGYRIFFARKTLESRLGREYEPVIFAALNSAKVMIVLGTKAEHFNSAWVRNEWSRFIHISRDAHKTVIPAYRDMSPYELPEELSVFQSQDMSKIGFLQDLLDGIERCMRVERNKEPQISDSPQSYGTAPLERLLQNGTTFLKLSNYSSANEVYTTVTKEYPEDYRGWWGLIVCKTRKFSKIILDQTTLNIWFRYVKQLAEPKDFKELENQYVEYTRKVSQLAAAKDMKAVNSAIDEYNSRIGWLNGQIELNTKKISECENAWRNQEQYDNNQIRKEEQIIIDSEKNLRDGKKADAFLRILFVVAVIALFTSHSILSILLALLLCVIGFCVVIVTAGTVSPDSNNLSRARGHIENIKACQARNKSQLDKDVTSLRRTISDYEAEIVKVQGEIAVCRRYLDLGTDKISEYWFSKECEAFGVKKPFDTQVQEYRKAVFNISEEYDV